MENEIIAQQGLTFKKAEELLITHGTNEITAQKKHTILLSFFSQFNNFLILLLIAAGGVSFALGEMIDSLFIFCIVLLNAFFGVYQEFKAEKALDALKNVTITTVRVVRDGSEQMLDSKYLVPGDIIYVEEGVKIPADAQIIRSRYLEINEASLTGESLPILKSEHDSINNTLLMGTVVAKGRAYAKVIATGENTQFGRIAKTLASIKEQKTPLQHKLETFSKQIGVIGIAASFLVFILAFMQNKTLFSSFLFAVSLAVAAVPEGLPAMITITLALGVEQMSKKKAIVRKLNAIETLGSITLIATDKTGTLTTNQMRVKKTWIEEKTHSAFLPLLRNGILCSTSSLIIKEGNEYDIIGDQTEGALLILAHQMNVAYQKIRREWNIVDESPFNPGTKMMHVAAISQKDSHEAYIFSKGAYESIIALCDKVLIGEKETNLNDEKKTHIENEFRAFSKEGLRVIAFAYRRIEPDTTKGRITYHGQDHTFIGFVGIADPVRKEAKDAVEKAQKAGIRVVMITGDNELTAQSIGVETSIIKEGDAILTGKQLDAYSDQELMQILPRIKIFARASPAHKHRLVMLFQKQCEVVAVTGDGVNDALALKQANVGVAMGKTGTDVAKEAADMVITDDNFATLVNAVEEGRNIFAHLKNVIKYLLTSNTAEVFAVFLTLAFKLPLIISALQILYINLVTDGLPALSLAFSPKEKDIMRQSPRKTTSIMHQKDFMYILSIGFLGGVLTILSFITGLKFDGVQFARTMAFTTLVLIQPLILIDLWLSHRILLKNFQLLTKPIFIISFAVPFIIQPFLIYAPFFQKIFKTQSLDPQYVGLSLLLAVGILIPIEVKKIKTFLFHS